VGIELPINGVLPQIVETLRCTPNLVIEAPPGAGKTTRVPSALLASGFREVLVLEPRRIAARMAARRVAAEMGESVGETIGYQVRFEQFAGPKTRLRFLTEGVLTRRLLTDPELRGVDAVVLDEFHERHLEGDLALALLRRLQAVRRPDLRLIVMSATLDAGPIAAYLGGAPVIRSQGRLYPLDIEHTPHSADAQETQIVSALEKLLKAGIDGDVLVFLPGAAEIRRAQRAAEAVARRFGYIVCPLHGDLPPAEQDVAVTRGPQPKVILSTNVAESSITIEGVRAVIDAGTARVARDSAWTGLPLVEVKRISRASATQRAGRAGRTGAGRVIRLYSEHDFASRPERDEPEILRRELAQLCLDLHACGVCDPFELPWLDAPPVAAVKAAEELLHELGALDKIGQITATGGRMAQLPLHPRLSRLAFAANEFGAGEEGCLAAAVLSSGERLSGPPPAHGDSDLTVLMERSAREGRIRQTEQQIRRMVKPGRAGHQEHALQKAVLQAFPDRVARRRRGNELLLAQGGGALLAESSAVQKAEFLVAVDIEERPERGLPLVRIASAIEPDWLLDFFPGRVSEMDTLEWNRQAERVEASSAIRFGEITIAESRATPPGGEACAALLAQKAIEAGLERLVDQEALQRFRARLAFASAQGVLPAVAEEHFKAAVRSLAFGLRSFAQLRDALSAGALAAAVLEHLQPGARRRLDEAAPDRIQLPSGRSARVEYATGQTPWVASRLQDFFGQRETPRIAGGRVPLVVHLLAPNRRPVQTTTDLAGFWERLYPQIRRELMRRYPRHAWPEDPYRAC